MTPTDEILCDSSFDKLQGKRTWKDWGADVAFAGAVAITVIAVAAVALTPYSCFFWR